jgi:hypothetical protein
MYSKEEIIEIRLHLLQQMEKYVMNTECQESIDTWRKSGIPENPTEEDLLVYAKESLKWSHVIYFFADACLFEPVNRTRKKLD